MFDLQPCIAAQPDAGPTGPENGRRRGVKSQASPRPRYRESTSRLRLRLAQARREIRELRQRVAQADALSVNARLMRRFVPRPVADAIFDHEDVLLRPRQIEVAVVFVDLRGFTAFTESTPPALVMETLAEYHAALGRVATRHHGILERFAGDGMLFYFEALEERGDAARRAARMVLQMRRSFRHLRRFWRARGIGLGLGIGIAAGQATVGPIGFGDRIDYAVIGTTTNLAARLSSEAVDGQVLICADTRDDLGPEFLAAPAGDRQLKGFRDPVTVFALGDRLRPAARTLASLPTQTDALRLPCN